MIHTIGRILAKVFVANLPEIPLIANRIVGAYSYTPLRYRSNFVQRE